MKHATILPSELNVNLNDVLTPNGCACMVIELIKYIIYQKQMIPYPYERLKYFIHKQLERSEETDNLTRIQDSMTALTLDRYARKTQIAYNSLEQIFKHIKEEITDLNCNRVEQIAILLGSTVVNPQDVFIIDIPSLDFHHSEKNHSIQQNCTSMFREVFTCDALHDTTSRGNCSSLYLLFKMKPDITTRSSLYIPRENYTLPPKGKRSIISFTRLSENFKQCNCVQPLVYVDSDDEEEEEEILSGERVHVTGVDKSLISEILKLSKWYQLQETFKSFTDVKIKGVSITNAWMNPDSVNRS